MFSCIVKVQQCDDECQPLAPSEYRCFTIESDSFFAAYESLLSYLAEELSDYDCTVISIARLR